MPTVHTPDGRGGNRRSYVDPRSSNYRDVVETFQRQVNATRDMGVDLHDRDDDRAETARTIITDTLNNSPGVTVLDKPATVLDPVTTVVTGPTGVVPTSKPAPSPMAEAAIAASVATPGIRAQLAAFVTPGSYMSNYNPYLPVTPRSPQLVPVAKGGSMVLQWLLKLIKVGKTGASGGGPLGLRAGGGILSTILTALGVTQIADIFLDIPGLGDESVRDFEAFLRIIDQMEQAGLIHPWTAKMRDGTPIDPRYLIFDLDNAQGFYTTFHMSRSGLRAHDDKQDTYKRPARAARSNRSPARRRR